MKINEKQAEKIRAINEQVKQLNQAAQSYLQGIADTLEVPENYTFDFEKMEFVPTQKNETKPLKTSK